MDPIPVSENHRRAIGTAFGQFDQLLGEVEEYATGRARHGVLFREVNDLTPRQRRALVDEVASRRQTMEICRRELDLPVTTECVASRIWGSSSAFWEVLVEATGRYLRRYGDVPPELPLFLDPRIEELICGLTHIVETVAAPSGEPVLPVRPAAGDEVDADG
ncbi:MAG: hypothetical protein JXR77_14230 [Lentisphaeria bacterium]|nr:hypothetical protein [Lentisphaeria bacterium]